MFWRLTGSFVTKQNDANDTFELTDRQEFRKRNQTTCTEYRYVSKQGEFSVMKPTMNQTVDNQNGEKSVGFESNRYKNQGHEVHNTSHNSTSSITSTDIYDESNGLDFQEIQIQRRTLLRPKRQQNWDTESVTSQLSPIRDQDKISKRGRGRPTARGIKQRGRGRGRRSQTNREQLDSAAIVERRENIKVCACIK